MAKNKLPFLTFAFFLLCSHIAFAQPIISKKVSDDGILVKRVGKPFRGDLGQMRERRFVRVLVVYSKTNFFFDKGVSRGFEYELLQSYEKFLNRHTKKKSNQMKMVFIPTPFDNLLKALAEGRGDIAAAGFTITPEREKVVKFTDPYIPDVSEVVVLHRGVKGVNSINDLSHRRVYVRPGSSYAEHLKALSRRWVQKGKAPIKVVEADKHLTTEDILELVNAGIVKITVADHHIAEIWSTVLPDIVVRKYLKINSGGKIAWAVRRENPKLHASLNTFIKKIRKGSLLGNILFKRYYINSEWIKNPITEQERKKLEKLISLFQKYAGQYGFEWLAIAAQAYQESGLDHGKKSPAGAVGIMQVLPSTASDKSINIKDIGRVENNIHAGVKYLHYLRNRYFNSPDIDPSARVDFAWAAYNAGPARIRQLREIAKKRGFNPNQWFYNVEKIAAEKIGRETVEYVANINKYYVAYKLFSEMNQQREENLKSIRTEPNR